MVSPELRAVVPCGRRRRGEKSAQSLLFPTARPFSTGEKLVLTELEGGFRDTCFCCAEWNDVASESDPFPPLRILVLRFSAAPKGPKQERKAQGNALRILAGHTSSYYIRESVNTT